MENRNKINIVTLAQLDKEEWNEFLLESREANYFCTTDYWEVFEEVYCVQLRNDLGELMGGILFSVENMIPLVGRFFRVSRAESTPLVKNEILDQDDFKKHILTALFSFLKTRNVIYFLITAKVRTNDSVIFKELKMDTTKCGTYMLDLSSQLDVIYRGFSKGCKSSIKKALKTNTQIKIYQNKEALPYLSEYLKLQDSLFKRRKNEISALYIKSENYYRTIFNSHFTNVFLAIAYYNDQPAAGAIITSFNDTIFYYQGASDYILTKESGASNLLQYEIIKYAKTNAYNSYDFGGADIVMQQGSAPSGVYAFKKSFGGVGEEFDEASYVVNRFRFKLIWSLRDLQNNSIVMYFYKLLRG